MSDLIDIINQLKELEDQYEPIFSIRRQVEMERVRQLKQGTRIAVKPLVYQCPYCPHAEQNPETFYLHLIQVHLEKGDSARGTIELQQKEYNKDISALESLTQKYTEVMLDVDYTDETRNT